MVKMVIKTAEFLVSNTSYEKCPPDNKPEFAFIGRSNVGKSSLINMLVNRRNLAKTSGQPGKTQTINHFLINNSWYLLDLPGFGYAGASRSIRKGWPQMIESYLTMRKNLCNTFVLIDSRLIPQAIDQDFIQWIGQSRLPFSIVFTKSDKLSPFEMSKTSDAWKTKLNETWAELPPMFVSSSEKKTGRDEILHQIHSIMQKEDH